MVGTEKASILQKTQEQRTDGEEETIDVTTEKQPFTKDAQNIKHEENKDYKASPKAEAEADNKVDHDEGYLSYGEDVKKEMRSGTRKPIKEFTEKSKDYLKFTLINAPKKQSFLEFISYSHVSERIS